MHDPSTPAEESPTPAAEPAFGGVSPTRFAADVEYSGRDGDHDYVARVRHRLLDTTFTLLVDGIEHDPVAEAKAAEGSEGGQRGEDEADPAAPGDDLRFTLDQGFGLLRVTLLRPGEDGEDSTVAEVSVRTVGLGGAGEVMVRRGFRRTPLIPAPGTPSALREAERAAHPARFAATAALLRAALYIVPVLGIGALFSGLLRPLREAVERVIRPVVETIARLTTPIREWIGGLLRPVRELLADLLRPVASAWEWLMGALFGWIPNLEIDLPPWLLDVLIPVVVVILVFAGTLGRLRRRREQMDAARGDAAEDPARPAPAAAPPPRR